MNHQKVKTFDGTILWGESAQGIEYISILHKTRAKSSTYTRGESFTLHHEATRKRPLKIVNKRKDPKFLDKMMFRLFQYNEPN